MIQTRPLHRLPDSNELALRATIQQRRATYAEVFPLNDIQRTWDASRDVDQAEDALREYIEVRKANRRHEMVR